MNEKIEEALKVLSKDEVYANEDSRKIIAGFASLVADLRSKLAASEAREARLMVLLKDAFQAGEDYAEDPAGVGFKSLNFDEWSKSLAVTEPKDTRPNIGDIVAYRPDNRPWKITMIVDSREAEDVSKCPHVTLETAEEQKARSMIREE